MNKIQYSYDQIHKLSLDLADRIQESLYKPDVIVSLIRGGLIPATIISHKLGINLYTLDISFRDRNRLDQDPTSEILQLFQRLRKYKNILVIDDISDAGHTLKELKKHFDCLSELKKDKHIIKYGTLHLRYSSEFIPEYFAEYLDHDDWIIYPWEQ